MIEEKVHYNNKSIVFLITLLVFLIPFSLSTGPFLPDLFLSVAAILFIYVSYRERLVKYYTNPFFLFFVFFSIILVLTSVQSVNFAQSTKASLTYIRFAFFVSTIIFLINSSKGFLKNFYTIFIISYLFVILNSYIQLIFGTDLFLNTLNDRSYISGFFGEEKILGSYLSRLYPIFLCGLIFLDLTKKNSLVYFYGITFLVGFIIFFTQERVAIFYFFLVFTVTFLFTNLFKYKKYFLLLLFISLISMVYLIQQEEFFKIGSSTLAQLNLLDCYADGSWDQKKCKLIPLNEFANNIRIFSDRHEGHFINAIAIFKDNPIFGAGLKTYRILCVEYSLSNFGYAYKNFEGTDCSTHPHHTYFQLLAETGLFGFIIISSMFTYIVFKILKHCYFYIIKKKKLNEYNFILLLCFFTNLSPLTPSGSFFNNWLSIIYFLPIGFYLYNKKCFNK